MIQQSRKLNSLLPSTMKPLNHGAILLVSIFLFFLTTLLLLHNILFITIIYASHMSQYERNEYTKVMNWSRVAIITLFAITFFFVYAIPVLKDTYGTQLLVTSQSSY